MLAPTRKWSISKLISLWFWTTLTTVLLVYMFTGKTEIALAIGGLVLIITIILNFIHEKVWNNFISQRKTFSPCVIWLTGLSGSGKSTIAQGLYRELQIRGIKAEHLDGDIVRNIFPHTGFKKEERNRHISRIGFLASILEKNGITVIASFISPYCESRKFVKGLCKNYKEIYLSTPLEVCEKRDTKGLYTKARAGEIVNFTGIDDPYEIPDSPTLIIDTSIISSRESINMVIKSLNIQ